MLVLAASGAALPFSLFPLLMSFFQCLVPAIVVATSFRIDPVVLLLLPLLLVVVVVVVVPLHLWWTDDASSQARPTSVARDPSPLLQTRLRLCSWRL